MLTSPFAKSGRPINLLVGKVVRAKMQRTLLVEVVHVSKHRKYDAYVRHKVWHMAHDQASQGKEGDIVEIVPCAKISAHKNFTLHRIITPRREIAEFPSSADTQRYPTKDKLQMNPILTKSLMTEEYLQKRLERHIAERSVFPDHTPTPAELATAGSNKHGRQRKIKYIQRAPEAQELWAKANPLQPKSQQSSTQIQTQTSTSSTTPPGAGAGSGSGSGAS